MESTMHRIRSLYSSMGPAEKKIADFILADAQGIVSCSVTELAEKCGCGDATVVRFSRRIGFDGFQALKIGIAREIGSTSSVGTEITKNDTCFEIYKKRINDVSLSLNSTESILDPATLEKAAQTIMKARRVAVFGLGNSAAIAMDAAHKLHDDFTARPGGMYMLDYDNVPDWSMFSGYANQLAFSLVQTVSHTQIMMYSDLAILLLRFAELTGPDFGQNSDAVNYYLGQFFYNNVGDYEKYFSKISQDSPFYLFAVLRTAEQSGDMDALYDALDKNPLFVPAINKLIAYNVQNGNRRAALRVINTALDDEHLNDVARAFFLKSRAHIYYMFDDMDAAQDDLYDASQTLPLDGEILALQSKIWAAQGREIENAYDYAMMLVKQDPTDIMAWDTLGRVITVREGAQAALDVVARVAEVSATCSSLFEQLGDLYVAVDDYKLARDAYTRAIELSDDGLVVVPDVQKKLRKIR